jgi:hypothetical protein
VLAPLSALVVLALTWGRKPGTFAVVVVALVLGAAVLSASTTPRSSPIESASHSGHSSSPSR